MIHYAHDAHHDVHIIVFLTNTKSAVDAYINALSDHIKIGSPLRILIDLSESGLYPLGYMHSRLDDLKRDLGYAPTFQIAYITARAHDITMLDGDEVAIFMPDERDIALEWLAMQG